MSTRKLSCPDITRAGSICLKQSRDEQKNCNYFVLMTTLCNKNIVIMTCKNNIDNLSKVRNPIELIARFGIERFNTCLII